MPMLLAVVVGQLTYANYPRAVNISLAPKNDYRILI